MNLRTENEKLRRVVNAFRAACDVEKRPTEFLKRLMLTPIGTAGRLEASAEVLFRFELPHLADPTELHRQRVLAGARVRRLPKRTDPRCSASHSADSGGFHTCGYRGGHEGAHECLRRGCRTEWEG